MFHRNKNGQKPDAEMKNEEPKKKTISPDELDTFAADADAVEANANATGTSQAGDEDANAGKAGSGKANAGEASACEANATGTNADKANASEVKAANAEAGNADAGKADAGKAEAGKAEAGNADAVNADAGNAGTDSDVVENLDTEEVAAAEAAATVSLFMAKVKKLEASVAEEHDRSLRLAAELANLRRRTSREQADLLRYSGLEVLRAILPVMDNLQRAIAAAEQQNTDDPLLTGVRMVYQQLETALEKNNCKKIHAEHEAFDPNFHEAISQMPSDEYPENTVLFVTQDGYMLADRVIRPSQVVVSKKA